MIRLLRRKEVEHLTGLSRSTIYRAIKQGVFPQAIQIGGRSVAWYSDEIEKWIQSRPLANQEG